MTAADPRTLIATAEQKLKDACKSQNAALALEAKSLLAHAADLLKDTDSKASVRQQFASQRCEDISDLMSHGIRVSDYKKICYDDIDAHLKLCPPTACSRLDGFEYFVASNPLVPKMSGTVLDLLKKNQLREALLHIRETGQLYREKCIYMMSLHCERQLAYLAIAMANQKISNVHASKAKTELCQAARKIGSFDFSTSIKVLNEAIRCETACQLISRDCQIADIEAFLNGNTPPTTRDQMIQTFYGLSSQTSAPSTSSDTRARPPQKPVPPTPSPHSYAARSFTPSPSPAVRGTTSSSSSTSDSYVFVNKSTREMLVSPTASDHTISTLASRKALFQGHDGQQIRPIPSTSSSTSPSSSFRSASSRPTPPSGPLPSSSAPVIDSSTFRDTADHPEVAKTKTKYRYHMARDEEQLARNVLVDAGNAALERNNAPLMARFVIALADHWLGVGCERMVPKAIEMAEECYLQASKILVSIDTNCADICVRNANRCEGTRNQIRQGIQPTITMIGAFS
jgi:hypothetical protein